MASQKGYNHVRLVPVVLQNNEYFRFYVTMPDQDMHDHFYALCPKPMLDFIIDILKALGFTYEINHGYSSKEPKGKQAPPPPGD